MITAEFQSADGHFNVLLKNVLYVPELNVNLLVVSSIQENDCAVLFWNKSCEIIRESDVNLPLHVPKYGNVYKFACAVEHNAYISKHVPSALRDICYTRLGHPSNAVDDALETQSLLKVSDGRLGDFTEFA